MNKLLLALTLGVSLTSCGSILFPKDISLFISKVDLPATVTPTENLSVTVTYGVGCGDRDQTLSLVSRTPSNLTLVATGKNAGMYMACSTDIVEKTLTYTDSGSPARSNPFEVIVNGKSWGKIEVKE